LTTHNISPSDIDDEKAWDDEFQRIARAEEMTKIDYTKLNQVIVDQAMKAANLMSDKGYEISTEDKAQSYEEFNKKRNYHYTNTDNPVDFPKE
jgi:hypothetical protein